MYVAKFEGKNNIHGFTDNKLLSVKPCRPMLLFIQTLLRILCAGAISRVSFYSICLDRLLGLCNHFSGECPHVLTLRVYTIELHRHDSEFPVLKFS